MKKLKKAKFINSGIFPAWIGYCNSKASWDHLMKYLHIKEHTGFAPCGRCDCFDSSSGGLTIVISLNPKSFKGAAKYEPYAMLAHEAKHAHDALMEYIREEAPSKEFSAYTIDWLVREGCKAFKL